MEYKDLIKLEFSRREYDDQVFKDRYGFKAFDLYFENGNIGMSWSPLKKDEVILYINNCFYDTLRTLPEVECVINCLRSN